MIHMAIYTPEQLKEKFKLSREQHKRDREKKKQLRIQQYKDLCNQADDLLKKAEQEAKKQLMEQLQALAPKKPQNALKQPLQPSYYVYNSNLIEREPSDRDLYTTKKQLQRWEATHWQCINWTKWDEVVEQARQKIITK